MPIKTDIRLSFSDQPLSIAVEKLSPNMLFTLGLVGIIAVAATNIYKIHCLSNKPDTQPKISDYRKAA